MLQPRATLTDSGGLLKQAVGVGHVARKGSQELGGHLAVVHAVVGCTQRHEGADGKPAMEHVVWAPR